MRTRVKSSVLSGRLVSFGGEALGPVAEKPKGMDMRGRKEEGRQRTQMYWYVQELDGT
jgi:hypothetical protein